MLVEHPGVPPPGPLSESWQRTRLFEALTHALHAGGQPLLLAIDDVQWCDRDTLEWLHYLLRSQPHTRLLLVATLRPEETGVEHPTSALLAALRRDGQLTEIAVPPLSVAETATLAAHVTGAGLAPALTTRLYSETEGNALFTVETARTGLLAQWATQAAGDVGEPASGQTSLLAVAPTVQAVIAWRLAQLSPGTREMAEVASVIGREFSFDLLAHAVSVDEEALIRSLDELAERRIVCEHAADAFDFSHDKIREAAYAGLSPARRRRLHRRVAAAIEQTHAGALEVVSGQLAAHYERAGERELAMRWYEQAAERAHRSDTYEEARRHLQHAIALAPEAEHARLYERLGDYTTGGPAVQSYAEALKRWRYTRDADPRVGARLLRKTLLNHLRYDTTRPSAEELAALRAEAWRLAEAAGDEDECWRIQVTDFFLPSWLRTYAPEGVQDARATALAAAAYFERRGEWQSFSEALDGYVALSVNIGAQAEALEAATRRLSIPSLTPQERGDALGTIAELYSDLGEYERCLAFATEALAGVSPGASVMHLAAVASTAALAACLCGRWSEIARFQATIEETWRQSGRDPSFSVLRLGCFGLLHIALAREDIAAAGAATAILEPLLSGLWGDSNRALLHAYRHDDPASLDLDPAQRRFYIVFLGLMFLSDRGLSAPPALLDFAGAWARGWQVDMALRCVEIADALAAGDAARLAQAIELAEAHGLVPHAARLQIVLAERTGDRAHLERARHVLQRLGDRQFLRRLEALSSSLE
jgi:tetratricopeptide (TPR) repeat protein